MTYYIAEAFVISGFGRTHNRQRVLELPDPHQRAQVSLLSEHMIKLPGFSGGNVWDSTLDHAWEFVDVAAAKKAMIERDLMTRQCFIIDRETVAEWYRQHYVWRVKRKAANI